jgi:hypothetical protein
MEAEPEIRDPDQAFFDVLAPPEEDNILDDELIIALNQSVLSYEREKDHLKNQEKYEQQIERLKKEDEERRQIKIKNEEFIIEHNTRLVVSLIRTIIYSGLDKEFIQKIKKAIDLFCENKTKYILLNSSIYEELVSFLELKKHRLSQEYIESILPYIREILEFDN